MNWEGGVTQEQDKEETKRDQSMGRGIWISWDEEDW